MRFVLDKNGLLNIINSKQNIAFLFDLDGTVTAQETLPLIAKQYGLVSEMEELTAKTIAGDIPFVESFITRVNLLKPYSVKTISQIIHQVALHTEIVRFIKGHKDNCYIVTGNLDCWIEKLVRDLGCAYFCSRASCVDDRVMKIKTVLNKAKVVKQFKQTGQTTVFIGEGNNDAEAIHQADVGIAFGAVHPPSDSALAVASHVVYSELKLCQFLKQLL